MRGVQPALSEAEITRERLALEDAVRRVEADAVRRAAALGARGYAHAVVCEHPFAGVTCSECVSSAARGFYTGPLCDACGKPLGHVLEIGHCPIRPGTDLYLRHLGRCG